MLLICTGAVFPGFIVSLDRKAKKESERQTKAEVQRNAAHHSIQPQDPEAGPSTPNVAEKTTFSDQDRFIQSESRQAGPLMLNVASQPSSSERDPNPVKVYGLPDGLICRHPAIRGMVRVQRNGRNVCPCEQSFCFCIR